MAQEAVGHFARMVRLRKWADLYTLFLCLVKFFLGISSSHSHHPFQRDFSACSVALFAGRASHASRTAPEIECVVSGFFTLTSMVML